MNPGYLTGVRRDSRPRVFREATIRFTYCASAKTPGTISGKNFFSSRKIFLPGPYNPETNFQFRLTVHHHDTPTVRQILIFQEFSTLLLHEDTRAKNMRTPYCIAVRRSRTAYKYWYPHTFYSSPNAARTQFESSKSGSPIGGRYGSAAGTRPFFSPTLCAMPCLLDSLHL